MRSPFTSLATALVLLTAASAAHANMALSTTVVEFVDGERLKDVTIVNRGEDVLYIDTTTSEIINPESPDAEARVQSDPRTAELLVTPRRMVVKPGQQKVLRMAIRKPAGDVDRIYRVAVTPKLGKPKLGAQDDAVSTALKVLVGYEVLVMVRPNDFKPEVSITRSGRTLSMQNDGNSNLLVRSVRQCRTPGEGCVEVGANRLYAGEQWQLELPMNTPVEVHQSIGLKNFVETY